MPDIEDMIYKDPDTLLRMTIGNGQARVLMCRTTRAAQTAADTHLASDVAAAAMGRVLPGTAMLSCLMDEEDSSVTLTVAGGGAGGKITCVAHGGDVKITCDEPQAEVEPLADGRLDVPAFVGKEGRLTVIKDYGTGEPYVGTSPLVSGGIAEDLAQYFAVSEQTPSTLALGCLNQHGMVLSSGGILVQAMPGCTNDMLEQLEMRVPFFAGISREIYDRSLRELAESWFDGMGLEIIAETPLFYRCDCSREKMERALIATGRAELGSMVAEGKDVEMTCWFCRTRRIFTPRDIAALLEEKA